MATTTTIRVDSETHAQLARMSSEAGRTLIETVRDAAEALRRDRVGAKVREQMEALRADPDAWADYLAEGDATAVADGIGR